jgi:cell wall-associated NlpC family hydrolase
VIDRAPVPCFNWFASNMRGRISVRYRMKHHFNLVFILVLALTSGCVQLKPARTSNPGPAVTRREVLETATAYSNHQWHGTAANIFHGLDKTNVWIDTPDAEFWGAGGWYSDGRTNIGVPYCWGGASTLAEFDRGILQGRPAGYQFNGARKNHGDSALPVGVDCSGFVSCCWQLSVRRSTYDIGEICDQLARYDDLRPGDAVNKPYAHVILFVGWVDGTHQKMRVFESGHGRKGDDPNGYTRVHECIYDRDWLMEHGFVALRYKGIVESQ